MKAYSTFPKIPGLLEPHHQFVLCQYRTLVGGGPTHLKRSSFLTNKATILRKCVLFSNSFSSPEIYIKPTISVNFIFCLVNLLPFLPIGWGCRIHRLHLMRVILSIEVRESPSYIHFFVQLYFKIIIFCSFSSFFCFVLLLVVLSYTNNF